MYLRSNLRCDRACLSPGGEIQVESSVSGHKDSKPLYPSTTTIPYAISHPTSALKFLDSPLFHKLIQQEQHQSDMEGV